VVDNEPEPGSELEPLIDTDKNSVDISIKNTTREYKFVVAKKGEEQ